MSDISVRVAGCGDRDILERLWLLFRHDMSEFDGSLPDDRGRYRSERLAAAFQTTGWEPYVINAETHPVGLAIVRDLDDQPYVLNSFFIVRGLRRQGLGIGAARQVLTRHPGQWEVAFQRSNRGAAAFWPKVATDLAGDEWSVQDRPVPGRPELPPDSWIRFAVRSDAE